jgi:hypothetical protein
MEDMRLNMMKGDGASSWHLNYIQKKFQQFTQHEMSQGAKELDPASAQIISAAFSANA